jgi:hypothetical protein
VNLSLDLANGKTTSFGTRNGVTQAGVLSRFEALRYELAYRYYSNAINRSGFFLGAQLGLERHNAVNARLADGQTKPLFQRGSGASVGATAGYQWAFGAATALSLELAPGWRPGFAIDRVGAAALGITRSARTASPFSLPVNIRFSYSF